jgi:hypothetical protein
MLGSLPSLLVGLLLGTLSDLLHRGSLLSPADFCFLVVILIPQHSEPSGLVRRIGKGLNKGRAVTLGFSF